jgi:hypothetical protein
MEADNNTAAKPPTKKRHKLAFITAVLIVFFFLLNQLWMNSGSGEWELAKEENGVKVYTMKVPGSYLLQIKAEMRAKYSLNHLIAGLIKNSTMQMCKDHIPDCIDLKVIEPWSDKTMSDTMMWTLGLPDPLTAREILIQSFVAQDPQTKVVTVDVIAVPNKIPRNDDRIRLSYMQNRWTYTPLPGGEVDIEFMQDIDMGGLMPDLLMNLAGVDETYKFIHDQLPALLDRDILKTTKYDFIQEL